MVNERILIVDDQPMVAQICAEILAEAGYRVDQVCSGQEALARLEAERFDLLLADLKMPHVDGLTVLRRAREWHPGLAAIMITSYGTIENAVEALRAGARDFLLKPFDPGDLVQTVRNVLAAQQREQEALLLRSRLARVEEDLQRERDLRQALQVAQTRYQNLVETSQDLIWQCDTEGRYTYLNPAWQQVLGYELEEMLGKPFSDFQPPEYAERDEREFARLIESGSTKGHETVYLGKDGRKIHLILSARSLCDEDGRWTGTHGTAHDITERVRTLQALHESKERLARAQQIASLGSWDWDVKNQSLTWSDEIYRIFGVKETFELSYEAVAAMVHTDDREKSQEFVDRLLATADSAEIEFRIARPDGVVKYLYQIAHVQRDEAGNADRIFGVMQDITERKRVEEEIRRRADELTTLYEASRLLAQQLDLECIGQELIKIMEQRLAYEHGAVLLVDEKTGALEPLALSDQQQGPQFLECDKEYVRSKGLCVGKGIVGWVVEHGQAVRLGDVRQDPRYIALRESIRSELCVPLKVGEKVIGALNVETDRLDAYDQRDERLLAALAGPAALSIQNARLFEEVRVGAERLGQLSRRLLDAQETERRHIAGELHDEIGQALTVLKINLRTAQRFTDSGELTLCLDGCVCAVVDLLEQVRGLSLDLRPSLLDDLGLAPALRWYLERQAQKLGLVAHLACDLPEGRLPPEIEIGCFRIVQEALTNVMRHAKASQVHVDLRRDGDALYLTIHDDGKGFDVQAARIGLMRGESMGLLGMEERAHLLGGRIEIESEPGQGTEIQVCLPWPGLSAGQQHREQLSP